MGSITIGTPGGYYYYSLTLYGSLSAPVETRCRGFSVSDGTAGWQTSSAVLRRGGGMCAGTGVLSLQSLCSAQLECLVI